MEGEAKKAEVKDIQGIDWKSMDTTREKFRVYCDRQWRARYFMFIEIGRDIQGSICS